ncbi:MAG TPA: hypothetical protein VL172_03445 [Kofleriaceae bacterium]|nr:hypothetical protein [Kofleriaceae bacterium]
MRRSTWAMVAAPAEVGAGALVTYLALYVPSPPGDGEDGDVAGALGAAAKEAAGRLIMASVGMTGMVGGVLDLLFGAGDLLLPSPFVVRDAGGGDRMLRAGELATLPPTPAVQLEGHYTSLLTTRGIGFSAGPGLGHWATPHLRLRYTADACYEVALLQHGRLDRVVEAEGERAHLFFGAGPTVRADWLLGRRRHWGRYPARSLVIEASGRVVWSTAGDRFLDWRAAIGYQGGRSAILLGASQMHGRDRYPQVDLGYTMTFETD